MLLGIYDDLLLSGGAAAAAALTRKLYMSGWPLTPNTPTSLLVTRDLTTYQTIALPLTGPGGSVAVGNELMVIVGAEYTPAAPNGQYVGLVSKDGGATFTRSVAPANTADVWYKGGSVAFAKGLFVVCNTDSSGYMALWSSPDGVAWTRRAAPFTGSGAVAAVNGQFFLLGYDTASRKAAFAISADGQSFARGPDIWQAGANAPGTLSSPGATSIFGASYVNGFWVLGSSVNNVAEIAFSTDLANWTRQSLPWATGGAAQTYAFVASVVAFNGLYYAFGSGGGSASGVNLASSPDLKNWTNVALSLPGRASSLSVFSGKLVAFTEAAYPNISVNLNGGSWSYPAPSSVGAFFSTDGQNFAPLSLPNVFWDVNGGVL